jgi:hypothetical protein
LRPPLLEKRAHTNEVFLLLFVHKKKSLPSFRTVP